MSEAKRPAREWFDEVLRDIASLKVQGAEAVARAAVKSMLRVMEEEPGYAARAAERLLATRPTEPMMRNALAYFVANANERNARGLALHLLRTFNRGDHHVAHLAARLIKEGGVYFTHCHSSTVMQAFKEAWLAGKRFTVKNTETRPFLQGRRTAEELAAFGIPVVHCVDSAARVELKGCDAVFIGADALLRDGKVVNKIGSEMIAELAHERGIPVYVLALSWKYVDEDAKRYQRRLERRPPREIWENPPPGVTVRNDAFEFVKPGFITAIISDLGIHDPLSAMAEFGERRA